MPKSFLSYSTLGLILLIFVLILKGVFGSIAHSADFGPGYQEYDFSAVPEGTHKMTRFGTKHIIIIHRSSEQREVARQQFSYLKEIPNLNMSGLENVKISESSVSIDGEGKFLIFYNTNPTRGCVLLYGEGAYDAWFDPCAGGHWDMNGVARKGPGDNDLRIPRYFLELPNTLTLIPDNVSRHRLEQNFIK